MLDSTIFIIRNGEFGSDFESKFFTAIVALLITLFIWWKYKNRDYFWVYIIGTIIWSGVEFGIQLIGLREFNPVTLFGVSLPLFPVAILRGAAEGGVVALFGLGVGDLILNKSRRIWGILILLLAIANLVISTLNNSLPVKIIGGEVASRRDIFAFSSLAATVFVTIISVYWLTRVSKDVRRRALTLFWIMIITSGIWTVAQVYGNLRWVEVISAGSSLRASWPVEFGTLFYDVVFEIGFMYIPFFAIPYILKLLKQNELVS